MTRARAASSARASIRGTPTTDGEPSAAPGTSGHELAPAFAVFFFGAMAYFINSHGAYRIIYQLTQVSRIYDRHARVRLGDLGPHFALSHLTSRAAIASILIVSGYMVGFAQLEPEDVFHCAFNRAKLPMGITRHLVGGRALGVDRIVMILAGENSIREVIAFPKTARAVDLMCEAPTPVSAAQLKELGLELKRDLS